MCVPTIIDASVFGLVLDPEKSAELHLWIKQGHGRVVYTKEGGYGVELKRSGRMLKLMEEFRRADRARRVATEAVHAAAEALREKSTRSGEKDKPVLALAWASGALVLCSDDRKLKWDFVHGGFLPDVECGERAVYSFKMSRQERDRLLAERQCRAL